MSSEDFLADLKAGDEVCISSRWHGDRIVTVSRVTATQIVIDGEGRFRRRSGFPTGSGGGWDRPFIREATQAMRDGAEKHGLESWLESVSRNRKLIPLAALRAMKAAFVADAEKKAPA